MYNSWLDNHLSLLLDDGRRACFMLVYCLTYSSALKMEATRSSETSVDFPRTTRRYIAETKHFRISHIQACIFLIH
jgi:hypothetical protein